MIIFSRPFIFGNSSINDIRSSQRVSLVWKSWSHTLMDRYAKDCWRATLCALTRIKWKSFSSFTNNTRTPIIEWLLYRALDIWWILRLFLVAVLNLFGISRCPIWISEIWEVHNFLTPMLGFTILCSIWALFAFQWIYFKK